jgi:hypothetical protein
MTAYVMYAIGCSGMFQNIPDEFMHEFDNIVADTPIYNKVMTRLTLATCDPLMNYVRYSDSVILVSEVTNIIRRFNNMNEFRTELYNFTIKYQLYIDSNKDKIVLYTNRIVELKQIYMEYIKINTVCQLIASSTSHQNRLLENNGISPIGIPDIPVLLNNNANSIKRNLFETNVNVNVIVKLTKNNIYYRNIINYFIKLNVMLFNIAE